jgi:thiosulfate dehydrogenase [quinone] large subunit
VHKNDGAEATNHALAFGILRLTLGINICLHGVQRFGQLAGFANGVIKGFDGVLPHALVAPYAYALPFAEAWQRYTLAAGALLMASLTFGSALRGQHDILAEQLGYELAYFVLLATLTWDRFSIDTLLARRAIGLSANYTLVKERS